MPPHVVSLNAPRLGAPHSVTTRCQTPTCAGAHSLAPPGVAALYSVPRPLSAYIHSSLHVLVRFFTSTHTTLCRYAHTRIRANLHFFVLPCTALGPLPFRYAFAAFCTPLRISTDQLMSIQNSTPIRGFLHLALLSTRFRVPLRSETFFFMPLPSFLR